MSKASLRLWISTAAAIMSSTLLGTAIEPAQAADKISAAVIPIADCAPIFLAKEKGFFSKHGLEVELSTAGGGAAIIPGVISGQMQIGFSNISSMMIAQTKGLNLVGIAPGASSSGEAGTDFAAIIVGGDSQLKSAKELEGKTVAVNNLNNIGDTSVRAAVRKAGGDPSKVKFVEVPFPDMPAALANKRIEAGWIVEPFLTIARDRGAKVLSWNLLDVAPKMMIAVYFVSEKYAQENPDIVKRFKAAITEALAYSDSHPDEVRKMIPTFTRIAPEVAAKINLPKWPTELNRQSTQILADLALQDGLVTSKPNVSKLLP